MAKRAIITKTAVDALKPGQILYDDNPAGFVARCLASGRVSYGYRYRHHGKSRWLGLGLHGAITADQARTLAKKRAGEVADSRDPTAEREEKRTAAAMVRQAEKNTVDAILDTFEKRHVVGLRSSDQVKRAFKVYVRPRIGTMSIYEVRKSHINKMLNEIVDEHGPVMADRVLAHVRKAFNWYAAKGEDDQFNSPIIRGMGRSDPAERRRERILADDEIREIWAALDKMETPSCYPAYVRFLLLTAARRNEAARMTNLELEGDNWVIPGARYKRLPKQKQMDHVIPLNGAARELIFGRKGFLFSTTGGKKAFSGFSKAKAELDRIIAKDRKAAGRPAMPRWTLHDLRRTARTLMSRAKVPSDHAERALGHVMGGVRGTYDRHEYLDEKRQAFEALAKLVTLILDPPADNVVRLEREMA